MTHPRSTPRSITIWQHPATPCDPHGVDQVRALIRKEARMLCDICRDTKDGPGVMRLERRGEFHGIATLKDDGWHIHCCPQAREADTTLAPDPGATPPSAQTMAPTRRRRKKRKKWCLGPESNQRHADFQSAALPTELPRPGAQMARKAGFIGACGPPVQQGKQGQFGTLPPHAMKAGSAIRPP